MHIWYCRRFCLRKWLYFLCPLFIWCTNFWYFSVPVLSETHVWKCQVRTLLNSVYRFFKKMGQGGWVAGGHSRFPINFPSKDDKVNPVKGVHWTARLKTGLLKKLIQEIKTSQKERTLLDCQLTVTNIVDFAYENVCISSPITFHLTNKLLILHNWCFIRDRSLTFSRKIII